MKLIGSAGSLEDLLKGAINFWCGSSIRFEEKGNSWDVFNAKGKIDGVQVVFKKNRYRLESI